MSRFIIASLLLIGSAFAQLTLTGAGPGGAAGQSFPATSLGVHAYVDNGTGTPTTIVNNFGGGTTTAGSTLRCWAYIPGNVSSNAVSIADSQSNYWNLTNSGIRESGAGYTIYEYYAPNVPGGTDTVTVTYTTGAAHGRSECYEVKNAVKSTHSNDGNFVANQKCVPGTCSNANTGKSLTPSSANEFTSGAAVAASATTFTASGTALDPNSPMWQQYNIQTTATATTMPWTNTSVEYAALMSGTFKETGAYSSCDADIVIDFVGTHTNGSTPVIETSSGDLTTTWSASNATADVHGNAAQPNSDKYNGSRPVGWQIPNGTNNITWGAAPANSNFKTSITCPFYSGNGVQPTTGHVMKYTSNGLTGGTFNLIFPNISNTVTAVYAVQAPDWTPGVAATIDLGGLADDTTTGFVSQYVIAHMRTNGTQNSWDMECVGTGCTVNSQGSWVAGVWYVIRVTYNAPAAGGAMKMEVWSWDGTTLTPVTTLNSACTGACLSTAGPATQFGYYWGTADTYNGFHFYESGVKINLSGGTVSW